MSKRYMVYMKSGRKFMVKEMGNGHTDWGNVNPATKKLEKVASKTEEIIDDSNTQITKDNGFKNIVLLDPGTSPLGFIDALDKSGLEKFEKLDCGTYLN